MDHTPPLERPIQSRTYQNSPLGYDLEEGPSSSKPKPLATLDQNVHAHNTSSQGASIKAQYGRRRRNGGDNEESSSQQPGKSVGKTSSYNSATDKIRVSSRTFRIDSNKGVNWHKSGTTKAKTQNYGRKTESNSRKDHKVPPTGIRGLSKLLESSEPENNNDEEASTEVSNENCTSTTYVEAASVGKDRTSLGGASTTSNNSAQSHESDIVEGLQFTEETENAANVKLKKAEIAKSGNDILQQEQLNPNETFKVHQSNRKTTLQNQKRSSVARFNRMGMKSARAPSMNVMRRVSVGYNALPLPGLAKRPSAVEKLKGLKKEADTTKVQPKDNRKVEDRLHFMGAVKLPGLGEIKSAKKKSSPKNTEAKVASSGEQVVEKSTSECPRKSHSHADKLKVFEFVLEYLDSYHLLHITSQVCKAWNRLSRTLYSWRAAETRYWEDEEYARLVGVPLNKSWYPFLEAFPWGKYLTSGGYKEVYEVWCAALKRKEAVAIMDVKALSELNNFEMVKAEVQTSCLLSELVRTKKCPHYVEVFQVFPHECHIPKSWWGSEESPNPWKNVDGEDTSCLEMHTKSVKETVASDKETSWIPLPSEADERAHYQYIRMELCKNGDLEEFLREYDGEYTEQSYTVSDAIKFIFQMAFSLYVGQEEVGMCHYDIKLLNFLLKPAKDFVDEPNKEVSCVYLNYNLEDTQYQLSLPLKGNRLEASNLVKLADFGTADCDIESIGKSIQPHHFTTFENVPPEFLLYGDASTQGFHNDMWNLGLCVFHCLTGSMPYEEILEEVKCPESLIKELEKLWKQKAKLGQRRLSKAKRNSQRDSERSSLYPDEIDATLDDVTFLALGEILKVDEDHTLAHTLWRYLVLIGFPGKNGSLLEDQPPAFETNPVWALLHKFICPETMSPRGKPTRGKNQGNLNAQKCAQMYEVHFNKYSITCGSHPLLGKLQSRLENGPGMRDLLAGLLTFSFSERLTGKQVLQHPAFKVFETKQESNEDKQHRDGCGSVHISME